MKLVSYTSAAVFITLIGCSEPAPPPIDTKAASIEELKKYYEAHCQKEFKMHLTCIDVQNEKSTKTNTEMRRKPGAIANFGTPEEVFGKSGSAKN